ncbi:hypothetical protein NP493_1249g00047 [Ridgeia piscesae]|uniref:ABC transmembrane type-1 domain-containing protein n=1 Tax=Ridgeia piscesae TaxID=27915 RepID=A0AAD9KBD9_RIDPI|nr:hypothetical protein NP493_1249g00047 [Ridgeia piscesae]
MPLTVYIFSQAVDMFLNYAIAKEIIHTTQSYNESNGTKPQELEDITVSVVPLCLNLFYLGLGILVVGSTHMSCWKLTSNRQVSRLRSQLFSAILHQDCAWLDSHDTGSLTVIITKDIVNVQSGMSDKVSLFIQGVSVFVISLVMAVWVNWHITLVAFVVLPPLVLFTVGIIIVIVTSDAKQGKAYEQAGSIAKEVLSAIRTVAAFGGEAKDAFRYKQCLFSARKVGVVKGILIGIMLGGTWFCQFSLVGLVNWYGTNLVVSETNTTAGQVIFVMLVLLSSAVQFGMCLPHIEGISTAGGSAQTIFEIIDTKPQIESRSEYGVTFQQIVGNIEFKQVDFVYESRPEIKVLDQVSLKTEVGKTIALVGPSGSGKSTICHLLLRLYDCTAGRVTVDGHDIKDINVKWLRQQIGVVSQEPVLFDGSISDNIRLGREGATQADIEEAAKMANAHNFIRRFRDV